MPGPAEVSGFGPAFFTIVPLYLPLWRSLPQACSCGGRWLRPVSIDLPGLGPLPWSGLGPDLQRLLVQVYSLGVPRLAPGPTEVSGSSLLPQWLLTWTCSSGVCSLRPAEVTVSGPFL